MACNKFKCVYGTEEECEPIDGECIGDLCECWKDCRVCKNQNRCKERKNYQE